MNEPTDNDIEQDGECRHRNHEPVRYSMHDRCNVSRCHDCGELLRFEIDPVLRGRE